MGTVNSILFPAHLSIMFRHNRYQPNIFDIIFINGSTIIHFTHYDLIVRTKPHFYFVACYWFRRPKCSMLRAHYYFKDWYAAVRLQAELPTRAFYGRLSFRGKHLFHVSVRKRIYIPSEHDARQHFRTLSTQISYSSFRRFRINMLRSKQFYFFYFHLICPKFQRSLQIIFKGMTMKLFRRTAHEWRYSAP